MLNRIQKVTIKLNLSTFCSILMLNFKVKIYTKWQNNENTQFLMKVTDTDWVEVKNSDLSDTFVEVSSSFDSSQVVILKKDRLFLKLVEGELWSGLAADNFTDLINIGHWQLPKQGIIIQKDLMF